MISQYHHISKPAPQMLPHYDVVVVGSGYGGGVAACRMARTGKRVVILERGKERWPGEYPEKHSEVVKEIHVSKNTQDYGNKTGLYRIYLGDEQDVVCANGLGGTSLINADVALKADDLVWKMKAWPEQIKKAEIEQGYERGAYMLQPQPYPADWPKLPKLEVLEEQATLLGLSDHFYRPPITTTFRQGVNNAGVYQKASTLTGNETTGINDGSKNSTLMNYIPDAWNHGAEIFCEIHVKRLKQNKKTGKWIIFYEWLADNREQFAQEAHISEYFVTADMVFLGAGVLGTTEIMLRSKSLGLRTSDQLGKGFSGNGDILGFGYNLNRFNNGISTGARPPTKFKHKVGPCITGIIDMRRGIENVVDGFVIEEGVCPEAVAHVYKAVVETTRDLIGIKPKGLTFSQRVKKSWRQFISPFTGVYGGVMAHTQTFLVMSHDDSSGKLGYKSDRLQVGFRGVGKTHQVEHINEVLAEATNKLGGTYVPEPLWTKVFKNTLVSVHPLGGCIMAEDALRGVVNHKGQVFKDKTGTEVYEGLYICDASIIPTSLGVNPFFTITALAERVCQKAAEDHKLTIDMHPVTSPIDFSNPIISHSTPGELAARVKMVYDHNKAGMTFSEIMRGHFSTEITNFDLGEEESYLNAERQARTADATMTFLLSITAYDAEALVKKENHQAELFGTVTCRALSPDPILITSGRFSLLALDENRVDSSKMAYNLDLLCTDGTKYRLEAYKLVSCAWFTAGWGQTTTLFVKVTNKETDAIVGLGVLHISPHNFLSTLTTLKIQAPSWTSRINSFFSFTSYFTRGLTDHYFPIFNPLSYPEAARPIQPHIKPLLSMKPETYTVHASDGVASLLTRYNNGSHQLRGPVLLVHGAAMSHEMWTTSLLKRTIVDELLDKNYDVWLIDYRLSPLNKASREQHTLDSTRLDIAAGVKKICDETKVENIAVIAHCTGSIVTFMGLLDGTIKGVGTFIASQVGMNPEFGLFNNAKGYFGLTWAWKHIFRQEFFDVRTSKKSDLFDKFLDQLFRFVPVGATQVCSGAVCHRATFCYGLLYQHENINQQLHDHSFEFFQYVNITTMIHLVRDGLRKKIFDYNGKNVYLTKENVEKNLKFPILFIHGEKNSVYNLQSTKKSHDILVEVNGPDLYKRHTIPNYGHLDCWWGRNSLNDVFPHVLGHLDDIKDSFGYKTTIS